jgi:hypothetical protein
MQLTTLQMWFINTVLSYKGSIYFITTKMLNSADITQKEQKQLGRWCIQNQVHYSLRFKLFVTIEFWSQHYHSYYSKNYVYIMYFVCDLLHQQRFFKSNLTFCIFALIFEQGKWSDVVIKSQRWQSNLKRSEYL